MTVMEFSSMVCCPQSCLVQCLPHLRTVAEWSLPPQLQEGPGECGTSDAGGRHLGRTPCFLVKMYHGSYVGTFLDVLAKFNSFSGQFVHLSRCSGLVSSFVFHEADAV